MLSDFQSGLLSTAIGAFEWAANSFNCGFLNYIFMVTTNSTIALRQTDVLSSIRLAIYQNLFQGGRRNLEVYHWLPSELQDGSGASHNVAVLTGIMIFVSILLIILPLTVIVVNCSCCCCSRIDVKTIESNPSHERNIRHDAYFLGKFHAHVLEGIKSSDKNAERFNLCHIVMFAVTFVFIAGLLVSIVILFIAADMVADILTENASTSKPTTFEHDNLNIIAGVQFVFSQILDFLDTGITKGRAATDDFLVNVHSTFMNLLEKEVSKAVDELLVEYEVQPLVQTGETLQKDLAALQTNMEYIRLNNQQVSSNISQLVGKFKVIHELVVPELNNVCAVSMGTEIATLCDSLKIRAPILLLQFNASEIKADPPAVLNFIFQELGVDLTQILGQFSQLTLKILEIKALVLTKVAAFLDLNSLLVPAVKIWDIVNDAATSVNGTTDEIMQNITRDLPSFRRLIYALVYMLLASLLGFLVAHSIIAVLYALEAKKTKLLYSGKFDVTMNCNGNFYDSTRVCSNIGNLVHAIIFLIFLIFGCILIIVLLPACAAIASDGCVYLVEQRGVAQADYVLNSYVENEIWPKVIEELEKFLTGSVKDFLVLSSPRNIINASTVVCRPSTLETKQTGLLGALGWSTFVSIKKVFNSSEVQKNLEEGDKAIKTEILNLNLASLIPSDMDQMIRTAQNLTLYLDNIDYQPSIDELSPSKQPTAELASYADDLESLILKIEKLGLSLSDILKRCVNLIRTDLVALKRISVEASKLRDAFIAVQNHRNLTTGIEDLVKYIDETKKTFSNQAAILAPISPIYWKLIDSFKDEFETDLSPVMELFINNLFPCSQIYMATDALLTMTCSKSGGLSRLFSWLSVLAVAVSISTLLFLAIFQLGFMQTNHFRSLEIVSKAASTPISGPNDRHVPFPPNTLSSSYLFHTQTPPPYMQSQQQQQNHRLAAPIPAIVACADRQYHSPLSDDRSAEISEDQEAISDSGETKFYEVPSFRPIPAPRSAYYYPISESEHKEEISNCEQVQPGSLSQEPELTLLAWYFAYCQSAHDNGTPSILGPVLVICCGNRCCVKTQRNRHAEIGKLKENTQLSEVKNYGSLNASQYQRGDHTQTLPYDGNEKHPSDSYKDKNPDPANSTYNKSVTDGNSEATIENEAMAIYNEVLTITSLNVIFDNTEKLASGLTGLMKNINKTEDNYSVTINGLLKSNSSFWKTYQEIKVQSQWNLSEEDLSVLLFEFNASGVKYPDFADKLQQNISDFSSDERRYTNKNQKRYKPYRISSQMRRPKSILQSAVKELDKFIYANVSRLTALKFQLEKRSASQIGQELEEKISELESIQPEIELFQNAYQGVANHSDLPNDL
ncbi:hypothetical protein Aperf_G00000045914 [Anoplocephala perfoliata]